MLNDEDRKELLSIVSPVRRKLQVVKIVATRSLRGKKGDSFVGMSTTMESGEPQAGSGTDLLEEEFLKGKGRSLHEGRIAALLLGLEVDQAALRLAFGSGDLQLEELNGRLAEVKSNYSILFEDLFLTLKKGR